MKKKIFRFSHLPNFVFEQKFKLPIFFLILLLAALVIASFMSHWLIGLVMLSLVLLLIASLYFYTDAIEKRLNHYIISMSYRIKNSEQEAFIKMPIGILLYDEEYQVQWTNPYLAKYFKEAAILGRHLRELDQNLYMMIVEEDSDYNQLQMNGHLFHCDVQPDNRIVYMMEVTEYANINQKYQDQKFVFGHIFLDNYDEISQSLNDRRKSNLNNFVTNQLTNWALKNNIYIKRVDDDRFIAILNRRRLKLIEKDRFDIIDHIRETTAKQNYPLTLSMGFAYESEEENHIRYNEIVQVAQANLDLALGRGGDQVVVCGMQEEARFYGGKTNPMEKRTRVRSRMVSQALQDLMIKSDQVIVMGHCYPDMDSVGGCLGIRRIAQMNDKNCYIVLNPDQFNHDIAKLIVKIQEDEDISQAIISPEAAEQIITENTLLVMVDVHKPSISQAPALLEATKKVVIIDHHRRGQEFPKAPVLVYIEPYASSTGELVTELFEYQSSDAEPINAIEATTLLAGIIVDTRNFSLRTGSRTFDAASYLKSCGADTVLIQKLLKENLATYLQRSHILSSMEMIEGGMAIATGEEDKVYSSVLTAQTADTMLSMEDVEASFVITKREDKRIGISARSLGVINVQRVMEQMNGGGHLSNAATQLEDTTIQEAKEWLIKTIYDLAENS